MKLSLLFCALLLVARADAQVAARFLILADDGQPLAQASATVSNPKLSARADSAGILLLAFPNPGTYRLVFSYVGMNDLDTAITIGTQIDTLSMIILHPDGEDEEEIIISTTRTGGTLRDIPTRIETISGEELQEKANMKPGDIRMMLSETTGIQTQQTSATSANSSIRIQGLDGRYTQILRDGFPLYSGFAGGLSLMQVTPLDLRQVEVVKGASSTLYGGGAIAGLVNLVSKTPSAKREISFLANGTTAGGLDLSGFYSERFRKTGVTMFSSSNSSAAYDPAGIGLTAIPKVRRFTVQPRLFYYGNRFTANAGVSWVNETRTGGSLAYIREGRPGYFEKNKTDRIGIQADVKYRISGVAGMQLKTSVGSFHRVITLPGYRFEGMQTSSYNELNYQFRKERSVWIAGLNYISESFREHLHGAVTKRDYALNTAGAFVQNTLKATKLLTVESGLRVDRVAQFGTELLPRLSLLFRFNSRLTARVGGGFGYKSPTIFTEDAERIQFRKLEPIDASVNRNERAAGGNLDLNYRLDLGEVKMNINQLFFYTRLNGPLVLTTTPAGYAFRNANGHIDTKGLESNLKISYHDFKLYVGYTHAFVNTHFDGMREWLPLSPKNRLNQVLMYEKEARFKFGLEGYYFGPQKLGDGAVGRSYWITGFMAEVFRRSSSLFINFENFLDARQTRFDTIYTGTIDSPVFRDIYAPLDGFVVNGGIKLRL